MPARQLLARVKRLEQVRSSASPFERWFGSLDAFDDECRAGVNEGRFDPADMAVVVMSVRRWHTDGVWAQ